MNVFIFHFTFVRPVSENPAPTQFPAVHFHVLLCSIVFIFCVPRALNIFRNI
jgi:hypothetical protein